MTTRGVFRLSSYRSQELEGDGVPIDDVWTLDKLQQNIAKKNLPLETISDAYAFTWTNLVKNVIF